MTTDTEGFVATNVKDVLLVCTIAEAALKRLIGVRRRAEFPQAGHTNAAREKFKNPTMDLIPGSGMVRFSFTCDGEVRTMHLHLSADHDHLEYTPKSIAVSMGASGGAETYIRCVLHALSVLGPAWYDANDCDAIVVAPMDLPRPTVMALISMGQLQPYDFENMRDGLVAAAAGVERAFLEIVGCSEPQTRQFDEVQDPTERWDALRAFARKCTEAANEPPAPMRRRRP